MRPLGRVVDTLSSQETVYLESSSLDDPLQTLRESIQALEQTCKTITKKVAEESKALKMEMQKMKSNLDVANLFLHQGKANALRAFNDFVLDAFYEACGMQAASFKARSAWLAAEGEKYVVSHAVSINVFGVQKSIGKQEFALMKALRQASSQTSFTVLHSATPIEVASALESEGKDIFEVGLKKISSLFEDLFQISPPRMVKQWQNGSCERLFLTKFKAKGPP